MPHYYVMETSTHLDRAQHTPQARRFKLLSFGAAGTGNGPENHPPPAQLALSRKRMNISAVSSSPFWRSSLAASIVAGALGVVLAAVLSTSA